jgi:hypothetical protein
VHRTDGDDADADEEGLMQAPACDKRLRNPELLTIVMSAQYFRPLTFYMYEAQLRAGEVS